MKEICVLENPVMDYAWGSHKAIARLLGHPEPSPKPQAELWMGAHPKAPSRALVGEEQVPLTDLIAKSPDAILGPQVAAGFGGHLPFLFKVLAVSKPLSIQAHPTLEQAKSGFAREDSLGIPLTAPHRSYKDNNHKPEIVCALTPFWGLCGFRPIGDMIQRLRQACLPELSEEIHELESHPDADGLQRFCTVLLLLEDSQRERTVGQVVDFAHKHSGNDPVFHWILKLSAEYPEDAGVLMPLLLNLVRLEPGQAMFLEAGELHAYLKGVAVEVMANSDNVLRGGLTPKYVDVPELLHVLKFQEKQVRILTPGGDSEAERIYSSPAEEFRLSVLEIKTDSSYRSSGDRSVEILLCVEGRASIRPLEDGSPVDLTRGTCVLVPAATGAYSLEGRARLYKAAVP